MRRLSKLKGRVRDPLVLRAFTSQTWSRWFHVDKFDILTPVAQHDAVGALGRVCLRWATSTLGPHSPDIFLKYLGGEGGGSRHTAFCALRAETGIITHGATMHLAFFGEVSPRIRRDEIDRLKAQMASSVLGPGAFHTPRALVIHKLARGGEARSGRIPQATYPSTAVTAVDGVGETRAHNGAQGNNGRGTEQHRKFTTEKGQLVDALRGARLHGSKAASTMAMARRGNSAGRRNAKGGEPVVPPRALANGGNRRRRRTPQHFSNAREYQIPSAVFAVVRGMLRRARLAEGFLLVDDRGGRSLTFAREMTGMRNRGYLLVGGAERVGPPCSCLLQYSLSVSNASEGTTTIRAILYMEPQALCFGNSQRWNEKAFFRACAARFARVDARAISGYINYALARRHIQQGRMDRSFFCPKSLFYFSDYSVETYETLQHKTAHGNTGSREPSRASPIVYNERLYALLANAAISQTSYEVPFAVAGAWVAAMADKSLAPLSQSPGRYFVAGGEDCLVFARRTFAARSGAMHFTATAWTLIVA